MASPPQRDTVPPGGDNIARADAGPVHFTVRDQLGENQISEQVTIILDGRRVGDLTVNADYPETRVEISVSEAGRHDYTVDVSSLETDPDGMAVERSGTARAQSWPSRVRATPSPTRRVATPDTSPSSWTDRRVPPGKAAPRLVRFRR